MDSNIKKAPISKNPVISSSSSKKSSEFPRSDFERPKNTLSASMNLQTKKVESPPDINKNKSAYPSELKPIEQLIQKTAVKLSKIQEKELGFFREAGMNIYETLAFGYVEGLFKACGLDYILTVIDMMKSPEYHVLTNTQLQNRNRKISSELSQKYLKAQNSLISLFEEYVNILLNDISQRMDVIYDFYARCSNDDEIKFAVDGFLRGWVAGFCLNNKRPISENYKVFNLEEKNAIVSDFDLITYTTDMLIDFYEGNKGSELKICKRHKNGIDGEPFYHLKIYTIGFNYYILYSKDQQPLLEKKIKLNNLTVKKKEEIQDKTKVKSNEKIERPNDKIQRQDKPEEKKNNEQENHISDKRISNKQEKPEISKSEITFSETCEKCLKKSHNKALFKNPICKHYVCFECLAKSYEYQSYVMSRWCPNKGCSGRIYDDDMQEYFSQIQINESITMSSANNEHFNDKPPDIDSEASMLDLEPKLKCILCHQNTPQSEIFTNPDCLHCYCHSCAVNKLTGSTVFRWSNICQDRYCARYISPKALEKYLQEYLSKDAKKNLIEVNQVCYSCRKSCKVSMPLGTDFDFFQCKACKVTSCLTHCAPLNNCFCYCENCRIRTEADWMKQSCRFCPDCKRKFCLICNKSLSMCQCYCPICESPMTVEKDRRICEKCEESCAICRVQTNRRSKIVGVRCGHTYCRACAFSRMDDFSRDVCLMKKTY